MMNRGFTVQEQEELNKASNALNLDAETKKLAFNYLQDYKQKIKQIAPEKLSTMIGCAILAAAKSQVLTTVQGDTIKGVGISITQLLRGLDMYNKATNLGEFLMSLKEFITVVTLASDISNELKTIINKFAFSYTFYAKYNSLFNHLELDQPMSENNNYLSCLKNFGWLLYINARVSILQSRTEFVESVFLLASTLNHLLYNMPKDIVIPYFKKNGKNIYIANTDKKDEEAIQEGVFELLKLNASSSEDVLIHQKSLYELVTKLIEGGVLRSSQGLDLEGVYDPKLLFSNFEKLDAYYQRKLGFDDLDERFFDSNRKTTQTVPLTPFARQGSTNNGGVIFTVNIIKNGDPCPSPSPRKTFHERIPNYELTEHVSMRSNLHEIRGVPASPFAKLPPATPVTRALEMYNWLSDKVRLRKNNIGLTPVLDNYLSIFENKFKEEILNRANSLVEKALNQEKESVTKINNPLNEKKANDKHNQMVSLYLKVLEELLSQEERKTKTPNYHEILSNENFHKALIACSIETVFFVNNCTNVTFPKLLEICDIQAFEFWRIIGNFSKFDPQMPLPIRKNLYSIEFKILMNLAWKRDSVVHKLIKKFIEESKEAEASSPTNHTDNIQSPRSAHSLISSLGLTPQKNNSNNSNNDFVVESSPISASSGLKQAKTELTHSQELFFKRVLHQAAFNICQLTDLLGINEKTSEQIWNVVKYILSSETTLLIDRHIDQIILCSVYGVCKVLHHNLKFQEIITKYQELTTFDKNEFVEIIHQVYINENERADLIKFYNSVYICQMKTYLFSLSPQGNQIPMRPGTPQVTKKPLVLALVTDSPLRGALPSMPFKSQSVHSKPSTPVPKYLMTPRTSQLFAHGESPNRNLETFMPASNPSKRQIIFDDVQEGENSNKKVKSNPIVEKILEQKDDDSVMESNKLPASKKTLFELPSQSNLFNRFSMGGDIPNFGGANTASTNSILSAKPSGFALSHLQLKPQGTFQINTSVTKMNVEPTNLEQTNTVNSQSPQQSQSASSPPGNKPEQSGFKKVQKKEGTVIPELKN